MNQELYDQLVNEGISEAKAEQIAKSHFSGTPEEVDAERLTKALEGLRETMETPVDNNPQVDFSAPPVADSDDVIGAITKGADAILFQNREHIEQRASAQGTILDRQDALLKGVLALGESVARIEERLDGKIAKGLSNVANQLAQPAAHRSVQSELIPTPGDVSRTQDMSRAEVISKALHEMGGTQDWSRRASLGQAVSLLESGENVATVVSNYNITTTAS